MMTETREVERCEACGRFLTGTTMSETREVTYGGEITAPRVTMQCRDADCAQHYVVRTDGTWWRAFHDEREARQFAEDGAERLGLVARRISQYGEANGK